jgi:regulator of cell morphogenesis and NO signaling
MNLEPGMTVRELALKIPAATRVFEKAGIDYCCGGQRSLADACVTAGVRIEELISSLEQAKTSPVNVEEAGFLHSSLAQLIEHIIETHHAFTRTEIQRLRALIEKVHGAHGQNHPELETVRSIFASLADELEPHMMKEECVLFPFIMRMEEAVGKERPIEIPPFGTVANPVRMMVMEHDSAGDLLKKLRESTSDYATPPDGCISYQTLYQALDALEKDLHQHIHLENNILFPKAVAMEQTFKV